MTPQQIRDEALFWLGSQDREHMLFLKLGIDPQTAPQLYNQAAQLYTAYENANRTQNVPELLALSGPSQALKRVAFEESKRRWIGWLFPIFYDHIAREIDYALTRMRAPLTPEQEMCFWTQIGAEHAQMAAQLLDPTEAQAMRAAVEQATKMRALHDSCASHVMPSMVALTKRGAEELDRFFTVADKAHLKSVIHPVLSAHIVREGRRFVQTMNALSAQQTYQNQPFGY